MSQIALRLARGCELACPAPPAHESHRGDILWWGQERNVLPVFPGHPRLLLHRLGRGPAARPVVSGMCGVGGLLQRSSPGHDTASQVPLSPWLEVGW